MARIGVDFGYGETGTALLDGGGNVLDGRAILHRKDIFLERRRRMRSARRRNQARRRRLRDFYALLKGMDLQPSQARPGQKMTEAQRILPGNRLYAMAHRRGWDYAEIGEMLLKQEDEKPPQKGAAVPATDRMLLSEFAAPAVFKKALPPRKATPAQKRAHEELSAAAEKAINKNGKITDPAHLRFAALKTEFLGEYWRLEKAYYDKLKKRPEDNSENSEQWETETAECAGQCEKMHALFSAENNNLKKETEEWMRGRLKEIYGKPPPREKEITTAAMVYLGLHPGEDLFLAGKIYRPHQNRHRSEMLNEMAEFLGALLGGKEYNKIFGKHFGKVYELNKNKAAEEKAAKDAWRNAATRARKRAELLAQKRATKEKREITREDIFAHWQNAAEKIINREYRKKRFNNRKIGKCPVRAKNGERCNKNLPRKNRAKIRALQFEIELRQMNILDNTADGGLRKLDDSEITKIMDGAKFSDNPTAEEQAQNRAVINGLPKTRKPKNESRGKKDILRDIACGAQSGRGGFCAAHLAEKLALIKNDNTESEAWARLHEERILTAKDAPPSIRQKVARVVRTVQLMLKKHNINPESITHIGLETARFDINSLAQEEGRKSKTAKDYQTSRRPADKRGLAKKQNDLCLLCGDFLGADINIDHFAPKSRGGSNARLNLVALCTECNINKSNHFLGGGGLNKKAMDNLRKDDPKKAAYLEKIMKDKQAMDNLTKAPQHTMFGAKILRGELQTMLGMTDEKAKEVFKKIRPQDAAILRARWFPYMNRQKRALRESTRNKNNSYFLEFPAGKESAQTFILNKNLFPANEKLQIENAEENGLGWLQLGKEKDSPALFGIPPRNGETTGDIYISAQNGRAELELIADGGAPCPDLAKHKQTAAGETVNIPLKNIFPEEWGNYATAAVYSKTDWLTIKNGALTGTMPQRKKGKPVPWPVVEFFDGGGELQGAVKIAVRTSQKIRIAVVPPPEDGIRHFNHVLDAAVLAANVDWQKIARLEKDIRTRNKNEQTKLEKEAQKTAPDFSAWQKLPERDGELCAPKNARYVYEDKENQNRISITKYDEEPYGFIKDKNGVMRAAKRTALPKLKRDNIKHIMDEKIRNAVAETWKEIDRLPAEEKKEALTKIGKDEYITEHYFTNLPESHILHPAKTRAARCWGDKGMTWELFQGLPDNQHGKKDERPNKTHYFRRTVAWEKVIVYKQNGKLLAARQKHPFYWKNKNTPDYENGITPPEKTENTFCRGDVVKIKDADGEWEIIKLGRSAALRETGKPENTKSAVYTNLSHAKKTQD